MRGGPGWDELELGTLPDLFYGVHRLDFEEDVEDDTDGRFHVLNLVDGEAVEIETWRPAARARLRRDDRRPGERRRRTGSAASRGGPCKVVKAFVR